MTDDAQPEGQDLTGDRISLPGDDVDSAWMARISSLPDEDVDRLLAGGVPSGADDLAPLADVALALRRRVMLDDVPAMTPELVRQLSGGALVVPLTPRRALSAAVAKAAAAAAAAAAAVVLLGVGASQNRLPVAVQNVVSSAAELVGVEVPRADERADPPGGGSPASSDDPADSDAERGAGTRSTSGGATPAEPGTPGDKQPATPADPPDHARGEPGAPGTPGSAGPPEHSNSGGDPEAPGQADPGAGEGSRGNTDPGTPPPQSNAGGNPTPPGQLDAADGGTTDGDVAPNEKPKSDNASETGQANRNPASGSTG